MSAGEVVTVGMSAASFHIHAYTRAQECIARLFAGMNADVRHTSGGSWYFVDKYSAAIVPVLITPPLQWMSTFSPAALASSNTLTAFSAVSGADSGA